MGEYADMVLNGDACEICGVPILDAGGNGTPRSCRKCVADDTPEPTRTRSVRCPVCDRPFRNEFGLAQHRAAKGH
jgi:hypothetical protein